MGREEFFGCAADDALHAGAEMRTVERPAASGNSVSCIEVAHRRRIVAEIVARLAQAEMHALLADLRKRTVVQQCVICCSIGRSSSVMRLETDKS